MNNEELKQEPIFSAESHSMNVAVATRTQSAHAGIIFNHILFWIKHNKIKGQNFIDGRTWMYETMNDIASHFSYLSFKEVRGALDLLIEHGYLIKKKHSTNKFDHTSWFALAHEDWIEFKKEITKCPTGQIDVIQGAIPHAPQGTSTISTDSKTYIEQVSIAQEPSAHRKKVPEISYSSEKRSFENVSEEDLKTWKELFPNIDIPLALKEMIQWLLANPSKATSNRLWRKFILNWLRTSNEKSVNRAAYQQVKAQPVASRHTGFQKDTRPRDPSKVRDFSQCD